MKTKKLDQTIRQLLETAKSQIITDIERCFGDQIWHRENDYEPNERDLHIMFDIINNRIFDNKLSRQIPHVVLKEDLIATGPEKYRGLEHSLAAFAAGVVDGYPTEIIMVKHLKKDNFFIVFCSLIHEMIHMYDYHNGPMRSQLSKYGAICGYDLNYLPSLIRRPSLDDLRIVNYLGAREKGLDIRQMPAELQFKIQNPQIDTRPRQYQFPGEACVIRDQYGRPKRDEDGHICVGTRPLPKKYEMHDIDGFYDVHGPYFKKIADKANEMGFGVTDVFTGLPNERAMRKVFESSGDIRNEADALYSFFDADHKAVEYRDPDNWYVEIF